MDKFFCVAPFVHMYAHPDGAVKTCCAGIDNFGNLKTNSLEEIWDNDKFTQLRKDFIAGDVTDLVKSNCATCVNFEKSKIHSLREGLNAEFTEHAIIEEKPDLNLLYIDFRFNNFCNFKCRGCYHEYSSSIANEDAGKPVPIIFAGKTPDDLYNQTLPHLEYTKKIYFAGGEPLIQWEHWKILDKLLEQNNTDISLVYNTNFSTMKYKNKNIVDYWKQFKNVKLLLSIDGMEEGGDWWRHGNDWERLQNNIETVKTECPHISLGVTCTVGWANLYTAMDLIDYCSDTHLINPQEMNINILQFPEPFSVQNVPDWKKRELEERVEKTLSKYFLCHRDSLLSSNLRGLINFMWETSITDETVYKDLIVGPWNGLVTHRDILRKESFFETFPEHINMKELLSESVS